MPGRSVSFSVASASHPQKRFRIEQAFTSAKLSLSTHSYPLKALQKAYHHLRGLPLQSFSQAQPLLLIGSDYPHLITPVERVHLGPPGGPAALNTRLGWTLQGPFKVPLHQSSTPQCLLTGTHPPTVELPHHMAQPWQMDVLPSPNVKLITRSKQDTATVRSQEEKTVRVKVDRLPHQALQQSVLGHRCGTGKRLRQESIRAEARSSKGTRKKPSPSAGRDGSAFYEPANLRKSIFCGNVSVTSAQSLPDPGGFSSYQELLEASIEHVMGRPRPQTPQQRTSGKLSLLSSGQSRETASRRNSFFFLQGNLSLHPADCSRWLLSSTQGSS